MASHFIVTYQLHSSEGSIDGERDFYFRRRVDLNSTACTFTEYDLLVTDSLDRFLVTLGPRGQPAEHR